MSTTTENTNVRCAISFASAAGVAVRGQIYSIDDPLVKSGPSGYFVDPDAAPSTWPSEWDKIVSDNEVRERAEAEENRRVQTERAKRNRVRLEVPATLRAVRDIVDLERGRIVEMGSTVLEDDPVVADYPDGWKAVS